MCEKKKIYNPIFATTLASKSFLLSTLVQQMEELVSREWEIKLQWSFREGNVVAIWLAAATLDSSSGLRVLDVSPERLKPILGERFGLK